MNLAVPAHLLGVTDPADTDHVAMVAFAELTFRLAELARATGRAADAVNELWALVVRLEARTADGHLEDRDPRRPRTRLGQPPGLPGHRPARRTAPRRRAVDRQGPDRARYLHHEPAGSGAFEGSELLQLASAMHGNELRKAGRTAAAVAVLQDAVHTARHDENRSAALTVRARPPGDW